MDNQTKFEIRSILGFSFFISLLWTLTYFPGSLSPDSIDSWKQALAGNYTDHHPVIMALLMRIFALIFGNHIEFYTCLQAFLFFTTSFLLIREIISSLKFQYPTKVLVVSILIFSAIPIYWVYSITIWKDVLICVFTNGLCLALIQFWNFKSWRTFLAVAGFLTLTVLTRHNAILILPALGLHFVIFRKHYQFNLKMKIALLVGALFVGSFGKILNAAFQVKPVGLGTLVFASQYLGYERQLIRATGDHSPSALTFWNTVIAGEKGYERVTQKEVACGDEWFFVMDPSINSSQLESQARQYRFGVPSLLAEFIWNHPVPALKHHLCVLNGLVNGRRNFFYYAVSENDLGITYQPKLTDVNKMAIAGIYWQDRTILRAHYPSLVLLLGLMLFAFYRPNPVSATIPFVGLGYFVGFCLIPQLDWRYLLLSYVQGMSIGLPYLVHFVFLTLKKGQRRWKT